MPCLELPKEENEPIGIWGQRHLRYLKQHRRVLYTNLLTNGKLNSHLAEIDKQAEEYSLVMQALVSLKNKLIREGRYTDAVDKLIIKFSKAKRKKVRTS